MCAGAERFDVLLKLMRGDEAAARFLATMYSVAHVWDDLIDGDQTVSPDEINQTFCDLLVVLPRNSFYTRHFDYLNPILSNAITNWRIATSLERDGNEYEKQIAFILRSSYVDLVTQCALLIGGAEYAVTAGKQARILIHGEGWDGYLENLAAEEAARANTKE